MAQDLAEFAKERGIRYFMISYTDLFGSQRAKLVPTSAIPANKAWHPYSSPSKWITPWRPCLPTRPSAKSTQKTCFKTVRVTFRPRYLPVLDSPSGSYAPLLHGRVRYWIIGPENGSKAGFPWHTVGCTISLTPRPGCPHTRGVDT